MLRSIAWLFCELRDNAALAWHNDSSYMITVGACALLATAWSAWFNLRRS